MKLICPINREILQDLVNIKTGVYRPLEGFMTSSDYHSVVNNMVLSDKSVWTIPITLDVSHQTFIRAADSSKIYLSYMNTIVGYVKIADCYKIDMLHDVKKVFKTADKKHPGVNYELRRFIYRIGGKVEVTCNAVLKGSLTSEKTKKAFATKGWRTVAGFQTRNPVHRAHEYLQRLALEICDGLFINPLAGWCKKGDFSEQAIMVSYKYMLKKYYPSGRVYLRSLPAYMRYAGPREAIFHAIIRRNLGCSHFIIGRDHAGVGNYYGKYEAQELAKKISAQNNLGIELLLFKEPVFCPHCQQIVSEKHCRHKDIVHISGTHVREKLARRKYPDNVLLRPEIARALIALKNKAFVE